MALPTQSSPFAAILSAVLARLSSSLGLAAEFVCPVATDRYPLTVLEDFFLFVQVFPPRPVNPGTGGVLVDQGAGRLARDLSRYLRIYIYSRAGVDVSGTDNTALMGDDPTAVHSDTPTVAGHLLREEQVFNALDSFAPLNSAGTCLTIGPLHVTAENAAPERKPEDDEGILRSYLDFEAVYVSSIETDDPAP